MSQKTDLQAQLTRQAALIENLRDKAAGGSGGDASTCTITITSFGNNISIAQYSSFENGEYVYNDNSYSSRVSALTLNNVLVGSLVEIDSSYNYCGWNFDNYSNFAHVETQSNLIRFVPLRDENITIIDDD